MDRLQKMFEFGRNYNKMLKQKSDGMQNANTVVTNNMLDRLKQTSDDKETNIIFKDALDQLKFPSDDNINADKEITIADIVEQQYNIIQYCINNKINPYDLLQLYIKYDKHLQRQLADN